MSERRRSSASSKSLSQTSSAATKKAPNTVNRIKLLSTGACHTGKSCLIKRYCEERFISKYIATIGVDYGVKPVQVDGETVRVNFWDLSGLPDFLEIRNEFYKDTQGVLLVYDVSARDTFTQLDNWIAEAAKFGANLREVPTALVANKTDKKRTVTEEEGRNFASARGFHYFEASASTGDNVNELFMYLFQSITRKLRV
mmetsp:Transcript_26990/g.27232  ORF Transcript_26990/g.27232 Transcript_26990/m.27232 type:complete len:199 (-) Transcript_26990:102-698(-)